MLQSDPSYLPSLCLGLAAIYNWEGCAWEKLEKSPRCGRPDVRGNIDLCICIVSRFRVVVAAGSPWITGGDDPRPTAQANRSALDSSGGAIYPLLNRT